MFDRVEHHGVERLARVLAGDFADGVRGRPARVIAGPGLAVLELLLDSPPEQPLHCPPAATFVLFHDGERTHRLRIHYARLDGHRPSG